MRVSPAHDSSLTPRLSPSCVAVSPVVWYSWLSWLRRNDCAFSRTSACGARLKRVNCARSRSGDGRRRRCIGSRRKPSSESAKKRKRLALPMSPSDVSASCAASRRVAPHRICLPAATMPPVRPAVPQASSSTWAASRVLHRRRQSLSPTWPNGLLEPDPRMRPNSQHATRQTSKLCQRMCLSTLCISVWSRPKTPICCGSRRRRSLLASRRAGRSRWTRTAISTTTMRPPASPLASILLTSTIRTFISSSRCSAPWRWLEWPYPTRSKTNRPRS